MDYSVLETSSLFKGIPAKELRDDLEATPQRPRAGAEDLSQRKPGECFPARPG